MTDRTIQQLNDIEDIKQLKARYCRLIDEKQWDELEADFVPDAEIEIAGGPGGADDTKRFDTAHAFIEGLRELMGPLVSVHQVHAPEIELVDAESARGIWTICDRLAFPDGGPLKILQGWGIYHETYRKISGRWQTASIRLERLLVEPTENEALADARGLAGKLLECIGGQDLDNMQKLFADEIDWYVPGASSLPWTGRRTRASEVPDFFSVMWPHYVPGKSGADISDIVADDRNAIIIGTFSHVIAENGNSFTTPVALHLKVEGGKIVHLQLYEDTLLITQAFGSADRAPAVGPSDTPQSLKSSPKNKE